MKDVISKNFEARCILVNKTANSASSRIEGERLRSEFPKSQTLDDAQWNSSVLQVLFKNEAFAKKYRIKIEQFLKDLLEEGEEFVMYHPSHSNGEKEFDDNHLAFHIDRSQNDFRDNINTAEKVPFYSSAYEDTLNNDKMIISETPEEEKPSQMTCFNCLGDHHMKNCPEKINRSRINANKKDILMGSTVRYHSEEQMNSLKPGALSPGLQNALGLKTNQLPLFIYHMRVIGYPPGWMDEATFENSGLSLYDIDGKEITDEKAVPLSKEKTLYDGSKFIDFPGFNSPVPEGFIDEWQNLKMPPLQPHQQLKEALKSPNIIMSSNMYKRKEFPSAGDIDSKKSKNVERKDHRINSKQALEKKCPRRRQMESDFNNKTPDTKWSNKCHNMSISMSPGTPILQQGNPYQKLPDADKFAEGITEHLPFENLPDATGKYEKMRGVICCVQKKMNAFKNS